MDLGQIRAACRVRTIRGKLVALTIGLFLLFIAALVLLSVTVLQDRFDDILYEQQFASTRQIAGELDNKLQERLQILTRAAGFVPADLSPSAAADFLAQRTSLQVMFSGGISIIGLDGKSIADYPAAPGHRSALLGDRDFFRQVVATKRPHIGQPAAGRGEKHPVLTLAVPVFGPSGGLRAVLAATADLAAPNFLGIALDRRSSGKGEILVIAREARRFVASTDPELALAPIPALGVTAFLDRAMDGFEGSGFSLSPRGVSTLYSAKQVPSANWIVVSALPTEVARQPVAVMTRYLYAATIFVTLLAVAVLWSMTHRMLSPLEETGKALGRMTAGEIPLSPLPIRTDDEVGHFIGNFNRLLAERQRYETALSDSEQRFRLLVESSPDSIFIQVRGRFAYVNEATVRLLGAASKEQILGEPCLSRIHPDSQAAVRERIRQINSGGGSSAPLEETYIRMDGSEVVVEVSAVPFHYDGEAGALVFVRDLTERKRGEQALQSLYRDFVTLLESTSDFIYFKDRESRFRFCSQTLARITGHRHWREMIGKHDLEVFPPDTARIYYEEELPVFEEGRPLLDRVDPYYDEAGKKGWVSTSKWPVLGDDGKTVVGIFGISRIISDRVQAEAELKAVNRELQAFTYAASHDIKAPLGRINSFSALLEQRYRESLEGDGLLFLDLIRRNATRVVALVEDLLAHAEIDQKILALEGVNLRELTECIVREYQEEIRQGKVAVQLDLGDMAVHASPHGLAQVLRNLIENALKYSGRADAPAIEIGARDEGGQCHLWVKDNGIGFDMAYGDRIFEVFRRLHTYEEFPGSGVGLALVKKAMEHMGGKVWAESEPGKGATFHLLLKAARQAEPLPAA